MLLIKICAVYYIFLNTVSEIHTLEPLSIVKDDSIAATEKAIRNIVDNLFTTFKIQGIRTKPKIRQFSTIHNFFVSITLLDCNSLEAIARLSRVETIDNNTRHFIAQINEVLNGDDKSYEENYENMYITTYVQKFIKELKRLKELFMPKEDNVINSDILKYLNSDRYSLADVTKDNITTSKTNRDSENENILDNSDFWQSSGRRIYKGQRTSIKRFPFLASIHIFDRFTCAGSIIKNDLIITSASCLQIAWNNRFFRENPAFLSVRVGCDYYQYCGETIAVQEIYFHPSYSPKSLRNNLAIMRIATKISFHHSKGRVKKIMIDRNPSPLASNTRPITAIGWGAKDVSNIVYDIHQNKLSYAHLDFFPLRECQEHYSKEFVTSDNFCAGFYSVGGGACNRDAGGPGVIDNTLIGVISFGSPVCGAPDAPTVFTKLGFYWDWIEEIMEQNTAETEAKTTEIPLRTTFLLYQRPTAKRYAIYPLENTPTTTVNLDVEEIGPTTKRYEMYPVENTPTTTVNLDDAEILRLSQNETFKDFLSTMFSSEEIATYVDVSDTETKDKINTDQNENKSDAAGVSGEYHRKDSKIIIKPASVVKISDYPDDTKENINDNNRLGSATKSQIKITVMENVFNDDKSLEEDIINLMDKLNFDEIVHSNDLLWKSANNETMKENSNSQKKIITSLKNITVSNKMKNPLEEITKMKKETLSNKLKNQVETSNMTKNQIKETGSSRWTNYLWKKVTTSIKTKPQDKTVSWFRYTALNNVDKQDHKDTSNMIHHTMSTVTMLKPVTDSNKADNLERKQLDSSTSDEYDDAEDEGLSIPREPFVDLTFRDRADNINRNGALSEAAKFELISLAIEEQTKKSNIYKQKRYLL